MADTTNVLMWRETLHVSNEDASPLVLFLEPWAESFVISPHSAIEVVAYGSGDGHLVIDEADNQLIVWGWTGSTVHVLQNGHELAPVFLSAAEAAKITRRRARPPVIMHKDRAPDT
ncbi:MAG: hypothetical protein AB7R89_24540 [Dehalococcoidia bacterium]